MTNHPNRNGKYELRIIGGLNSGRRKFKTFEEAEQAALECLSQYDKDGSRADHPAIIYGPEFSADGWTIR